MRFEQRLRLRFQAFQPGICTGAEKCSTALALIFIGYTLDRIQCFWSLFDLGSSRLQNSTKGSLLLFQYLGKGFDARHNFARCESFPVALPFCQFPKPCLARRRFPPLDRHNSHFSIEIHVVTSRPICHTRLAISSTFSSIPPSSPHYLAPRRPAHRWHPDLPRLR